MWCAVNAANTRGRISLLSRIPGRPVAPLPILHARISSSGSSRVAYRAFRASSHHPQHWWSFVWPRMANPEASKASSASMGQMDPEWFMKSHHPVLFPTHHAFDISQAEFETFLREQLDGYTPTSPDKLETLDPADTATETLSVSSAPSTTADIRQSLQDSTLNNSPKQQEEINSPEACGSKTALPSLESPCGIPDPLQQDMSNKMLTENGGVAHRSTQSALVDLFSELEHVVSGPRLYDLLQDAWRADPLMTLKIIFNARSIHLGKSSRLAAYRCFGWLATQHPLTLVSNLQWLSRPVIEKKVEKETEDNGDTVMVEVDKAEDDPTRFDIENGVAHGYWKDLLNILALSANKKLTVLSDPKQVLNVHQRTKPADIIWDPEDAKTLRLNRRDARHTEAVSAFENEPVHRALHITVARLFAKELTSDLVRLRSGDASARKHISLCAKWAPSQKGFHDNHTFIISSIAEIMHPQSEFPDVPDREAYLRRARDAYRKDVSALRKALEVVERDITAQTFENIKYDRVPSIAMKNYAPMFAEKDTDRFEKYIDGVTQGENQISGAVLLPSNLISAVRQTVGPHYHEERAKRPANWAVKAMADERMRKINAAVLDGQWQTLVKRVKDSGTMESSIAVCDVSGSMECPYFPDGTRPVDSAIGLSLLIAEITKAPFGGAMITFSENPTIHRINLDATLKDKYEGLVGAHWGMNTDFEAVFERLILPLAVEHHLKQEDMVKQIFVFSDMHFDEAISSSDPWSTSFERIEQKFKAHGYEMPKLIFWNLAGGRAGYTGRGDATAPKPVTCDQPGTALVSGYSQGMLKMFLDNGSFEDPEEAVEMEFVEKEGEGDDAVEVEIRKKVKMDPLMTVKKAVSHKAYSMLKVFD